MIRQLTQQEKKKLFNQRLQRVHISLGISFSFLMYIALFFGIFAILLPYIQTWEKPINHIKMADISTINYEKIVNPVLENPDFPKNNPITISLPGYMKNPTLQISTKSVDTKIFNPNSGEELQRDRSSFNLGQFLNYMHYGRLFGEFGIYIFGFMAVACLILMIGGLYQILTLKYKNSSSTQTGFFSKWHRKILLWTVFPFFIITLTGVMYNLGFKNLSFMSQIVTKGDSQSSKLFGLAFNIPEPKVDIRNESAKMLPLDELVKKAQEIAPQMQWHKIRIVNYGDISARYKFEGYNPYMPFLNGITNIPNLTLSGVDGSFIDEKKVFDKNWASIVYDSFVYIHVLLVADDFTRLFVAFLMIITILAIGFGNMLYLEKRARKFPQYIQPYQGFGKLSLAVMIGVIPSTAFLFVLQWLLPFGMENKILIQKGLFACFWSLTFTYSFYKLNSYQTAKDFLYLAGGLFILSSIIHFVNSGYSPIRLLNEELYTIFAVDVALIIFGLVLIYIAKKLPINREDIMKFWTARGVK
ncbi:PepSY-associated TM helix domain-containing protein [Aliarcobacter lanthieri]|uniref:PepSY-associated TM helix domain-containing protein n=1 Tax=Aliarcobacter lanthieri TaxID=1355374 RepID=UPI003AAD8BAA